MRVERQIDSIRSQNSGHTYMVDKKCKGEWLWRRTVRGNLRDCCHLIVKHHRGVFRPILLVLFFSE